MFWGLIMEPQKRYSQVIKKAFHISMASLDLSNSDGQPSQVMCGYEGRNYLLCTLQTPGMLQCPLDLCFEEGTTVSFATNGKSHVHLTGYLTKDDFEEGLEEDSDQEAQEFEVKPQKKPRENDDTENQPSKKKAKKLEKVEVEEEEDSDDSDVDMDKLLNMNEGEEQSEEESEDLDDEGSEEEDDESLEEEQDDDDDAEDEDEKEVVTGAAMMNGVSEKSKKGKKGNQTTPQKGQQVKEKSSLKQTPGPKATKKQENGSVEDQKKKGKEEKKKQENQMAAPKKRSLPGGVTVEDLREGQGDAAGNGKFVHVYYEGRLKTNNKVFDKTNNGPGFGFRLGKGEVIKGWDIGVAGMKVGGKRRITCPPHLGYGAKGSPPVIPPNSTLIFDVELRKVK